MRGLGCPGGTANLIQEFLQESDPASVARDVESFIRTRHFMQRKVDRKSIRVLHRITLVEGFHDKALRRNYFYHVAAGCSYLIVATVLAQQSTEVVKIDVFRKLVGLHVQASQHLRPLRLPVRRAHDS